MRSPGFHPGAARDSMRTAGKAMKILFASSEAHPLVKTGGLADVSGALPRTLRNLGEDIRLVLPAYRSLLERVPNPVPVARLTLGGGQTVRLLRTLLPGTRVTTYLVDHPPAFDRPGNPYLGPDGQDWPDNADRFALFARVLVELARDRCGLDWQPDLVHCNDWQTGLVPALLSLEPDRPATLFTIHNLAYQGLFDGATLGRLGLPPEWWSMHALEFHGRLSFIKGGLVFADWLSTVSPTYADEICSPEFGFGLDGLLASRRDRLSGILNGADYDQWNPGRDPLLPQHYNRRSLAGKAACKAALQRRFGLDVRPDRPLFGHIGRLVEQKGIDLILAAVPQLLERQVQLVVLGSGEARFEAALRQLQAATPGQVGVEVAYDEALAHLIEAGCDGFLMPSRFEPCGLNQIYSLRYGTVPVVHAVGGLADTVVDASPTALREQRATGFQFHGASLANLVQAIDRALQAWARPDLWRQLVTTGMRQDFSWKRSAGRYAELYRTLTTPEAVAERRHG